jgi:hypothetical protein
MLAPLRSPQRPDELARFPATLAEPDLTPGNSKLGLIWNWSLPAIITCPGRSNLCEDLCYASRSFYHTPSVRDKLFSNLAYANSPLFAEWMISRLRELEASLVRVHVAGDFFNSLYAGAWVRVFRALPKTKFYYYTRSWRNPEIRASLEQSSRRNVRAWYSCDAETGRPSRPRKGVRLAYMLTGSEEAPAFDADLVFRDKSWRPGERVKRVGGRLVCPAEQAPLSGATCDKCRICFDDSRAGLAEVRPTERAPVAPRRTALPLVNALTRAA